MPQITVTDGWQITEHVCYDGGTRMLAYIGDDPVWVASELLEPVGGYRWRIWPYGTKVADHPDALVRDAADARAWLEHEAEHALLAAKVLAA